MSASKNYWLSNKLRSLKNTYKNISIKRFLKKSIYTRREEILSIRDLSKKLNFPLRDDLKIQAIEKEDLQLLIDFYKKNDQQKLYPKNRIEKYFVSNCKCFIAKKNDKIIGHAWWGNNKIIFKFDDPPLKYACEKIDLKHDDAIGVDFFLIPEERGGGIALDFLSKVQIALNDLGYNRMYGLVNSQNRAARWTYKIIGNNDLETIVIHNLFRYIAIINNRMYLN